MIIIQQLLASYGLYFILKNSNGPFGSISYFRNILFSNRYLGVMFYKMFDCPICLGFWTGCIISYMSSIGMSSWSLAYLFILSIGGFASAALAMMLDQLLDYLAAN